MRYIKLFENFDQNSRELKQMASTVFDFLPFDTEINNPMNSSIPGSLDGDGVVEFCKSNPEVGKVGLFIGHNKLPNGGLIRYIMKSTKPLLMDAAVFDSKLDKVTETFDIDPTSINFGDYGKGMDTLGRFGVLGDE